jgi:hypothetical protein
MPQDALVGGMGGLSLNAAAAAGGGGGGGKEWGSAPGSGGSSTAAEGSHQDFLLDPMRYAEQQDKY